MKKIIWKTKNKGFTLVELIATIAIICLVFGLGTYGITQLISNSKEKNIEVTKNNLKKSGVDYINEIENANWIDEQKDDDEIEQENTEKTQFTCVSIQALINSGYYKKSDLAELEKKGYNVTDYIKINRNLSTKAIINEDIGIDNDANEICKYYYVAIPTCKNPTYDGIKKAKEDIISIPYEIEKYTTSIVGTNSSFKDAGTYNFTAELVSTGEYRWEDNTTSDEKKEITCQIKPKKITIKLKDLELNEDDFEGDTYISDETDILDYINQKADGLIDNDYISDVTLTKSGTDDNLQINISSVTILTEDEIDVTNNYSYNKPSSKLTIIDNSVEIPSDSICNNLTYNGEEQILATSTSEYYTLSNNKGTDAGAYNVIASLTDGFKWSDKTTENKTITCNIKKTNVNKVTLSEATKSYTGSDINFNKDNVAIYGINDTIISSDDNTTYNFTYYTDSSCATKTSSHANVGIYYGKVSVGNLKNYNDATSNCAKIEITNELVVTFNPDGGSVNPTSKTVKTSKTYATLPTPTKTGYIFKGWYTAKNGGGTKITSSTTVTATSSHTLYASWEEKYVEVTFHSLSYGSSGTDSTTTIKYTYKTGQSFCSDKYNSTKGYCERFTKTGYYISGWYFKELNVTYRLNNGITTDWINNRYTNGKSPLNAYANWSAKTIKVTFKRNYSSTDTTSATKTYTYGVTGQSFSGAASWTRTGYTRLGWALSQSATTKNYSWTSGVADSWINNNAPAITIYAVWADQTAPTCSVTKSNTYSSAGVDVKVTCSDSGSGCKTGTQTSSDLKASKTYTVYDKAGNKGTCTATIKTTKRYRKRTCSTCKSCSSAGCSTYSAWTRISSTYEDSDLTSTTSTIKTTCSPVTSGSGTYKCIAYSRSCTAYKTSCSSCGCSSWGSWTSYSYTSCSSSSSQQCGSVTVYY